MSPGFLTSTMKKKDSLVSKTLAAFLGFSLTGPWLLSLHSRRTWWGPNFLHNFKSPGELTWRSCSSGHCGSLRAQHCVSCLVRGVTQASHSQTDRNRDAQQDFGKEPFPFWKMQVKTLGHYFPWWSQQYLDERLHPFRDHGDREHVEVERSQIQKPTALRVRGSVGWQCRAVWGDLGGPSSCRDPAQPTIGDIREATEVSK